MKKTIRIVALMLVLVMSVCALASCGKKLSGEYAAGGDLAGTSYTFKGSKVTIEMGGVEAEGTYKIKGDKITIEFADENEDDASWSDIFQLLNGEHDFEKGDDYIKIGDTKYTKEK